MPLPSVSTPFDYLVSQIQRDLEKAVELCQEIKRARCVGKDYKHTQLNELQRSLEGGPLFIQGERRKYTPLPGSDPDGADDIARTDFTGYIRQVEEINAQLQAIAYPPTHHHGHHHHSHPLFFPIWDPAHHKEKEDPHFHTLRLKWENIQDGIPQTFAEMRARLEKKEKDEAKKKEDEDKDKAKKKEEEDKDKAKKKEDEEKAKKKQADLQKKLDEIEEERLKKLRKEEKHQDEQIEKQEDIQDKRNVVVEKVVKKKLEDDPIEDIDRLVGVIGHINRTITPRTSHEGILFNVNSSASGSGMGTGGGGGGGGGHPSPRVIVCDHRHDHHAHHHHTHSHSHSPTYSSISSSPSASIHDIPLRITNNVNTIHNEEEISDIEEIVFEDRSGNAIVAHPRPRRYVNYANHPHGNAHPSRSRSESRRLLEPETRHGEPGVWVAGSVLADLVRR